MKSACLFGLTFCCQKKYGGVGMQKKVDRKSDGAVKAAAIVVRLSSVRLVVVWPLCTPALYVDRCNI